MTCRELVAFLMSYLDGELPEGQQSEFRAHLAQCPDCVAYLETYRTTVQLGRAVCTCGDALPADVPPDLIRAILAVRTGEQ